MTDFRISNHASEQMEARGISEETVQEILRNPQQSIPEGKEKVIYQSILEDEATQKNYLVRIVVNIIKDPKLVITVYRTSKINKYWIDED